MTDFTAKNMSGYDHGSTCTSDDHTHGSIKDGDSTRSMYRWEGGDPGRMLEHALDRQKVESDLRQAIMEGSWDPSADIVNQPTAFFPSSATPSAPTIVRKVIARLENAGMNVAHFPGLSASGLADCLVKNFSLREHREGEGGHDVLLLLADCIAELNASLFDVANACGCSDDLDKEQAYKARVFLQKLRPNTFYYVNATSSPP